MSFSCCIFFLIFNAMQLKEESFCLLLCIPLNQFDFESICYRMRYFANQETFLSVRLLLLCATSPPAVRRTLTLSPPAPLLYTPSLCPCLRAPALSGHVPSFTSPDLPSPCRPQDVLGYSYLITWLSHPSTHLLPLLTSPAVTWPSRVSSFHCFLISPAVLPYRTMLCSCVLHVLVPCLPLHVLDCSLWTFDYCLLLLRSVCLFGLHSLGLTLACLIIP